MAAKKKSEKSSKKVKVVKKDHSSFALKNLVKTRFSGKIFKNSKLKKTFLLIIILAVVGTGLFFGKSLILAALVSGRPITRLELVRELEKQAGQSTLEVLINKKLILLAAQKKQIIVTKAEIQKELEKITKIVEAQGVSLDDALAFQGTTKEGLEERIQYQKTLEKLLADKLVIKEEDVKKYYDENKDAYPKDVKFEDAKDQIASQLKQEKLNEETGLLIENLKKEAKVLYFVNF